MVVVIFVYLFPIVVYGAMHCHLQIIQLWTIVNGITVDKLGHYAIRNYVTIIFLNSVVFSVYALMALNNYCSVYLDFLILIVSFMIIMKFLYSFRSFAIISIKKHIPASHQEILAPELKSGEHRAGSRLFKLVTSSTFLFVNTVAILLPLTYTWGMAIIYRNTNSTVKALIALFIHPLFTELIMSLQKSTLGGGHLRPFFGHVFYDHMGKRFVYIF